MAHAMMERQTKSEQGSELCIDAATRRIRPYIGVSALSLVDILPRGIRLLSKDENETMTGSYKVRGALNALLLHPEPHIAASAGNFGAGAAWAASVLETRLAVYVPETAPSSKRSNILESGGSAVELVVTGATFDDTYAAATLVARTHGTRMLEPFNDYDVISGQGTVAAEVLVQAPDTELMFVPVGGAGLLAGTLGAIAEAGSATKVIAVEFEGNNSLSRSLRAGEIRQASHVDQSCDGIAVRQIGRKCLDIVLQHHEILEGIVSVSRSDVGREIFIEDTRRQQLVPDYGLAAAYDHFPETTGFVGRAGAYAYAQLTHRKNETWVALTTGANSDPVREELLLRSHQQQWHRQK